MEVVVCTAKLRRNRYKVVTRFVTEIDVQCAETRMNDLAPIVRDEVYPITGEAVRNAFRHAQAARIEVEIR